MKTMEDITKLSPDFAQSLKDDPIHELFEGIDPRDLEVLPEEFKIYPGSSKGSSPQDDPEFYGEWMSQNLPKAYDLLIQRSQSLVDSMVHELEDRRIFEEEEEEEVNTVGDFSKVEANVLTSAETPIYHWQYTTLTTHEENVDSGKSTQFNISALQNGSYTDLPLIPDNMPSNWDQKAWFQQNWSSMRFMLK